ncbi:MAG: TonB-dependent receptor [Sulfurimonas sp.]|nr:TonB-dependent receptor [Sulfurimonas sp.]
MKKKLYTVAALLAVSSLMADSPAIDASEFESLLGEMSAIATKKSLNVDYLPSVVTVVDAQTFIDGGIQNLGEALGMLPGIQIQLSPMGYTMTTVRGFKNPNAYLSDKIKILVDGVAINNAVQGSSSFYMDFPMQLIEKIEVLRGPASTVYGAGAFYATVNIITKLGGSKQENQVFVGVGEYGYRTVGGNLFATANGWNIFTDGYYQKNDKSLYFENIGGDEALNQHYTDESLKDFSLGFKAQKDGLEFLARFKRNVSGNFYGFENNLNPIPEKGEEHINSYFFTQLAYKNSYNDYKFETKANFSHREFDASANIYSVESMVGRFTGVGIYDVEDGFFYNEKSAEQNYELESNVRLPEIISNDILLGVGLHYAIVRKDEFYSSLEDAIFLHNDADLRNNSNFRYRYAKETAYWNDNQATTLLKHDVSRTNIYAYAQDLIALSDAVDVTLGLRVDNYSDFGAELSKQAGIVYRASDEWIFKLLYGSAFRAPTFIEAYQLGHINFRARGENIEPEETNTYEAVVIYSPNFYNRFSVNVYYSELTNVIDLEELSGTDAGYQNFDKRLSRGIEFEYNFKTKLEHNFYLNASYIDAGYTFPAEGDDEPAFNAAMPDISTVMFKAIYIYKPTNKLSFGTTWRYFSETTATELGWVEESVADGEYSSTTKAASIFDETITYRFSATDELRGTVKNIFNEDVRMPAYYYETADGGNQREGRNWFLSYVHRF